MNYRNWLLRVEECTPYGGESKQKLILSRDGSFGRVQVGSFELSDLNGLYQSVSDVVAGS